MKNLRICMALAGTACFTTLLAPAARGSSVEFSPDAPWFLPLPSYSGTAYRDVDVTDVDGDALLDIFAPAHTFQAGLWLNQGQLSFAHNRIDTLGLGQDPEFPRWESGIVRAVATPTLHIYRGAADGPSDTTPTTLNLSWPTHAGQSLSVTFTFHAGARIQDQQNADLVVEQSIDANGRPIWVASGSLQPGAIVTIEHQGRGLAIDAAVDPGLTPSEISVGPLLVHPDSNTFTLNVKDRHGLAFADFMGDSGPDALWAVGGMHGRAGAYEGLIDDQVFANEDGVFTELGPSSGVTKKTCRGYRANVVDVDHDAGLDLYIGCLGAKPEVWLQGEVGTFSAQRLRDVAPTVYGSRWLDMDNDTDLELLATVGDQFESYSTDDVGTLTLSQRVFIGAGAGRGEQLQVADFDANGFQDVLIPSPTGTVLLCNSGGTFQKRSLIALGLPSQMIGAAWADIDSDGRTDLLTMPGGLFMQQPDGNFIRSGRLTALEPKSFATATFADLDNNGTRDIIADTDGEIAYIASNVAPHGHWLELDLSGASGNASGIGAWVTATTGDRTQTAWVGSADSSAYSQGHHRIYLGLGDSSSVDLLTVHWPDGTTTTSPDVAADALLRMQQAGLQGQT